MLCELLNAITFGFKAPFDKWHWFFRFLLTFVTFVLAPVLYLLFCVFGYFIWHHDKNKWRFRDRQRAAIHDDVSYVKIIDCLKLNLHGSNCIHYWFTLPVYYLLILIFFVPAMVLAVHVLLIAIVPFYIITTLVILRLVCRFGFASRNVKVNEDVVKERRKPKAKAVKN